MTNYEYIRLRFDWGDLEKLNSLSSTGWRVVAVVPTRDVEIGISDSGEFVDVVYEGDHWALLERPIYQEIPRI